MTDAVLAPGVDEKEIRQEVEKNLSALLGKSEDELRAVVGQLTLGDQMLNAETTTTKEALIEAGEEVAQRRSIRDIACDPENHKVITDALTVDNIASLVAVLLVALQIQAIVAVGVIALAVLLLKIGLNEYCRN